MLPGACRAVSACAGHAVDLGFVVPGWAGWQDVASRSVAVGDRLMRLVHGRRGRDGGRQGAGAGRCGRRGAGCAGCGAAGGDAGRVAAPAAGAQADGPADRRAGAGDPPVHRVHPVLAVAVERGAGRGVGGLGRVGAFDGPFLSGGAGAVPGVRVRSPLWLGQRVRAACRGGAGSGVPRAEHRGARVRAGGQAGPAAVDPGRAAGVLRRRR